MASWFAWHMALVPLAVWSFTTVWRGRRPTDDSLLIAATFALSWVADTCAHLSLQLGQRNMWVTYALAPAQFAIFIVIVRPEWQRRGIWIAFVLALVQFALPAGARVPGVWVMVLAGPYVAYRALRSPWLGRLRWPLVLYCGPAVPMLAVMGAGTPSYGWPWEHAWVGYQITRLSAFTFYVLALARQEATDGVGSTGPARSADGESGLGIRGSNAGRRARLGAPAATGNARVR